jgi:hypothetical protein
VAQEKFPTGLKTPTQHEKEFQRQWQTPRVAAIAEWRGEIHLRHYAALELRRGATF